AFRNRSQNPALNLLFTTSKHGRYFQEIGRRLASGESVRPPTLDEIQHFLETARRYGYWFATPAENSSGGITVRYMLAPKRLNDNTVYLSLGRRADRLLVALKGSVAALLSGSAPQAVKLKTKGEQNMKTELIIYALAALAVIHRTQAQSQAGN